MRSIVFLLALLLLSIPSLAEENDPLFLVSVDLRFGFINKSGDMVIKPQFFEARDFSEGLAAVKNDKNKWGYINKSGKLVIDFQFALAADFSEGLARVLVGPDMFDGLTGYIDKRGHTIIEPRYEIKELRMPEYGNFSEGLAVFEKDGKMGFIDKTGKVVFEPKYDIAYPFTEGLAGVTNDMKTGFIDKSGREVIRLSYGFNTKPQFSEGLVGALIDNDTLFLDMNGREVMRFKGHRNVDEFASNFSEGLVCWASESGKMGYLNKSGEWAIPPLFDYEDDFSEGLAAVEIDNKYGFIDQTGTMVIEPRPYLYMPRFNNGLARVMAKDDRFGYIDKKGQYVWDLNY
jgi:hypothetical protein